MSTFTVEEREQFLTALRYVLARAEEQQADPVEEPVGLSGRLGICYNATDYAEVSGFPITVNSGVYAMVRRYAQGWDKHTGIADYPVPWNPRRMQDSKWQGDQLDLRIDLLRYMIGKAEQE